MDLLEIYGIRFDFTMLSGPPDVVQTKRISTAAYHTRMSGSWWGITLVPSMYMLYA